jgi:dolichol kinase
VTEHPELPFLAAGTVAIIGGSIRHHGWPPNSDKAILGTVALTLVASATSNSRVGPLVHAIGLLLLLTAIMSAVNAVNASKEKPATTTPRKR